MGFRRRIGLAVGVVLAAILLLLAAAWITAPIRPIAVDPVPAQPLVGALAPNEALRSAERWGAPQLRGAEDVAFGSDGSIYTGTEDGRVIRIVGPDQILTIADTHGRPLGMDFAPSGRLVVADAKRGLLAVEADGTVEELVREVNGSPLGFANDVDVAPDGTVYFSDSSIYGPGDHMYDLLEGRPHGRLLRYEPSTGNVDVLGEGMYFANGVAVDPAETFVLVAETYRFRVLRVWLQGKKAGVVDVFVDELPGYPDGVSWSTDGRVWVALFTVRNATAEFIGPRPAIKRIIAGLPRPLWPGPEPYGFVLELDANGRSLRSLQDPGGTVVPQATSAERHGPWLVLGNLTGAGVARVRVDK